jgi:hypothetical protein
MPAIYLHEFSEGEKRILHRIHFLVSRVDRKIRRQYGGCPFEGIVELRRRGKV